VDIGIGISTASRRGEIHLDVAILSRLHTFGHIEVQGIALADPCESLFERRGITDRHTVAT